MAKAKILSGNSREATAAQQLLEIVSSNEGYLHTLHQSQLEIFDHEGRRLVSLLLRDASMN